MENTKPYNGLVFAIIAFLLSARNSDALASSHDDQGIKSYIVFMDRSMKPDHFVLHEHWYTSMLDQVSGSKSDRAAMLYTYDTVTHGFAAKLTRMEAQAMENMDGCLAVLPDSVNQIHTTRTPDFLGLSSSHGLWPLSHYGDDVIVGVLDTGIWPESKSFSDQGLTPLAGSRWKGECEVGTEFNASHCNNKIIGARYFLKGYEAQYGLLDENENYRSPRDADGHGTHTSSTAAGSEVSGSSFIGFAQGTARGIASKARLAVYKVCWTNGCTDSDLLAGMEKAVSDGVEVLSVSIGRRRNYILPYYRDSIAIGALGAIEKGIFVSCSAGNEGPTPSTISNSAPWISTVGASTIDREFPAPVVLGNGKNYKGSSLYKGKRAGNEQFPLVYGKTASIDAPQTANLCLEGSLDPNMVHGKIVVCDLGKVARAEKGLVVLRAGGAGMILANGPENGEDLSTDSHILPATRVGSKSAEDIKAYINGTKNPTASIKADQQTVVGKLKAARAPVVAGFSSRGPNLVAPEILKPDLVAPGVNILAAWSGHASPTDLISDKRRVDYNIISGTSMSCPHVTGIAALIRAARHSEWTPAAIKSALMTSTVLDDNSKRRISDSITGRPANAFAIGAGHVNPRAALDPGLVYDLGFEDYVGFLCSLNYTTKQIHLLTRKSSSCPKLPAQPADLNYPSFSVVFKPANLVRVTRRTVTNVGGVPSVYKIAVESPPTVNIIVEPSTLTFEKQNEKANFTVRFESKIAVGYKSSGRQEFGQIWWKCVKGGTQVVRSPVAIVWEG